MIALELTGMSLSTTRGEIFTEGQKPGCSDERPVSPYVVVYPEVCCVWLEFGFVSSSSYWEGGGSLVCESVWKAGMLWPILMEAVHAGTK